MGISINDIPYDGETFGNYKNISLIVDKINQYLDQEVFKTQFVTILNASVNGGNFINLQQPSGKQVRFWNIYDSSGNIQDFQVTPDSSAPYSVNIYSSDTFTNLRMEFICY